MSIKGADLTGQKYGRFTVIGRAEPRIRPNGAKRQYWKCRCECGAIKEVDTMSLTHGYTVSCGCYRKVKNRKDLAGQRFGRLTVIKFDGMGYRPSGQAHCNWLCKCDCGNEIVVQTSYLTLGETKSCGCLQKDIVKYHYEGMKFGNLLVIEEAGRNEHGNVIWKCKCDCGNDFYTTSTYLRRGFSTSCGCKTLQKKRASSTIHGMVGTKLYQRWQGMKQRCDNPTASKFHNYGGRGITYCKEWENFENFEKWALSSGYEDNLTLDRIDVNGNYEPDNCRWITNKEQQNNRRDNIYIPYKGVTKTLAEWSEITGKSYACLTYRYKAGWSAERIIETPIDKKHWSKKRRETNE